MRLDGYELLCDESGILNGLPDVCFGYESAEFDRGPAARKGDFHMGDGGQVLNRVRYGSQALFVTHADDPEFTYRHVINLLKVLPQGLVVAICCTYISCRA
jgi:hypothetical protein